MDDYKLGLVETKFAELIWDNAPMGSGELVKLCAKELEWKKSTTYTVLKKLCEKGLFRNDGGVVTALVSRKEYQSLQSRQFVEDAFSGSLPAFIAAFAEGGHLTPRVIAQIRTMIDAYEGGGRK